MRSLQMKPRLRQTPPTASRRTVLWQTGAYTGPAQRVFALLILLTASLLAPVAAAHAGSTQHPTRAASPDALLIGQVLAQGSNAPVSGAQVQVNGRNTITGADGSYRLGVPAASRLIAQVSALGYQSTGFLTLSSPDGSLLSGEIRVSFRDSSGMMSAFRSADGSVQLKHTRQLWPDRTFSIWIHGSSTAPLEDQAALQRPDGRVTLLPLQRNGSALQLVVPFHGQRGRYLLEINAASGGALIKLPLFMGAPYSSPPAPPAFEYDPATATLDQLEQAAAARLNAIRQQDGLTALHIDPRLSRETRAHSQDVVTNNYYTQHGHIGSDGSDPAQRVQAAGVSYQAVAEDIGEGSSTQEVLLRLMDSPAHRWAIFGDFSTFGIGIAHQGGALIMTIDFVR